MRDHFKIGMLFLERGADVDADGAVVNGRTALEGRLKMVDLILSRFSSTNMGGSGRDLPPTMRGEAIGGE
jgi:hypothetical protein